MSTKPNNMSARRNKPSHLLRQAPQSPVHQVRNIPPLVRMILFVQAGGRCEFDGCNKYLLEHHVTLWEGNFAEVAHIVAFRPDGPRGRTGQRPHDINTVSNLMVLCPDCHKVIDDHPERYTRKTLRQYKDDHERHVRHMTSLGPEKRTSVLILSANIGDQTAFIPFDQILEAVSPRYPASRPGKVIDLTSIPIGDTSSLETARETIRRGVAQLYDSGSELQTTKHLSVFALAPIPLLVDLGARLSNKTATDLFQRHRDKENWTWKRGGSPAKYQFRRLRRGTKNDHVAIMLSLSGTIPLRHLPKEIDRRCSIYELTLKGRKPSPTFLRTKQDLEKFRLAYQSALSTIMREHHGIKSLHFFPAVPAPVAILCGRELLPKVHPELLVYDFDKRKVDFKFQLRVNHQ